VKAGDIVVANLDFVMGHDGSIPIAIEVLEDMKKGKVYDPSRINIIIDHYTPSPNERVSKLHDMMRKFADMVKCNIYEIGEGICHQLMPEKGHVLPGYLGVGGDSHTCTYGALNAFSTGVGSTDLAAAMAIGRLWFRVPSTIKVEVIGKLPVGVYSKDLILYIIGMLTADGATYKAVEFLGEAIDEMSMDARFTITNMAVEMGAKAGIMRADDKTLDWLKDKASGPIVPIEPDSDAYYEKVIEVDVSSLEPQVAKPHAVDDVVPVGDVEGIPIQQAVLGTCTNGRIEDLAVAASILKGKRAAPGVRLLVTPASRSIYLEAINKGIIATLVEAGAIIVPPSCGWCCGACNGVPGDDENVISTANRNFKGRMGNRNANIYLGSPATIAASALEGRITGPRKYGGGI
jgi:3-isopropylmalate/(R)-2-methylmalate dehydratase large subunit